MLSFFFTVVGFVLHWNESAMDLHVFPIPKECNFTCDLLQSLDSTHEIINFLVQ